MVSDSVIYSRYGTENEGKFVRGVSALEAETGETIWRYHTDVGLGHPAAVFDGVLYVTPSENYYDPERGYTGYYLYALTAPQTMTGSTSSELGDLADTLTRLRLAGNGFTGCVPAGLADVEDSDLDQLGLEVCAAP